MHIMYKKLYIMWIRVIKLDQTMYMRKFNFMFRHDVYSGVIAGESAIYKYN